MIFFSSPLFFLCWNEPLGCCSLWFIQSQSFDEAFSRHYLNWKCLTVRSSQSNTFVPFICWQGFASIRSLAGVAWILQMSSPNPSTAVLSEEHHLWEYHPFAKWGCPPSAWDGGAGSDDLPAGSTFHSSSHRGSCRPTFSYLATHHLERLSARPPSVSFAALVGSETQSRCLVAFVCTGKVRKPSARVRRGSGSERKNCAHMMQPYLALRTPLDTLGYLWHQGNDPQGSGCGSAVPWYLVLFTGLVLFSAKRLRALDPVQAHTLGLCLLQFFFLSSFLCVYVHDSQKVQLDHWFCRLLCVISKPEAWSQGVLQPEVAHTHTLQRVSSNCFVFTLRTIWE